MLSNKKLFLFDIDGTVCQGERLIDGTTQFLEDIRQSGGQFVFITNNSTKSIQDYILKFQKLGIKTDYSNFITASYATIHYLKKNYDDKLIYVMGTKSLIRELKKSGIRVTTDCEDPEIACVLVAYDNELTYEKVIANLNVLDYDYYFKLTDLFYAGKVSEALLLFNEILEKGFDAGHLVSGLGKHFRDVLVAKDQITVQLLEVSASIRERYIRQAAECAVDFLYEALKVVEQCEMQYKVRMEKRLCVEVAFIRLCQINELKKKI